MVKTYTTAVDDPDSPGSNTASPKIQQKAEPKAKAEPKPKPKKVVKPESKIPRGQPKSNRPWKTPKQK